MTERVTTPLPIYLDYMATTPVDPLVVAEMVRYLGPNEIFGNPGSVTHEYGRQAALAVEKARQQVADAVGATPQEIVFTSGATEAINLAILGAAHFYQRKGRHVVTMSTEHKAVLDSVTQLESEGFEVTRLGPRPDGLLDHDAFQDALREDTVLVSLMHVNNEIGVIQDIAAIGEVLKDKGIIFHVDAAQSVGKLAINLQQLPVHLMSFSAHKNYGPKGIGALYIRKAPRVRLKPISFGGGQENGLRAGTLPTHQLVGMGAAFALGETLREQEQARLARLRDTLWDGIKQIPGIHLNGSKTHRVASNLNVSFSQHDEDALLPVFHALAVSRTSACSASSLQPSYVLQALGLSPHVAFNSMRFSVGRFTTEQEVTQAIEIINRSLL